MRKIKLKTVLMSLYVVSVGSFFLSAGNAFAMKCKYDGDSRNYCEMRVDMYPGATYKGVDYDIEVWAYDMRTWKKLEKPTLSYRERNSGRKNRDLLAMFPRLPLNHKNTYFYVTPTSKWSNGEWHTYGRPFCFGFNKGVFREQRTGAIDKDYKCDKSGGCSKSFMKNELNKQPAVLKFDPKPQTFVYIDYLTGKYQQAKIDTILSGEDLNNSFFTCQSQIGTTPKVDGDLKRGPGVGNRARWQIWYQNPTAPEGERIGVLFDSLFFHMFSAKNYECEIGAFKDIPLKEGENFKNSGWQNAIQPRWPGGCGDWRDPRENCLTYPANGRDDGTTGG